MAQANCTPFPFLRELTLSYDIDVDTGCWNWSRGTMANGYGCIGRHTYAHRFSYEQAHGPIPRGWHIHHKCENRRCINPEHLECVPNSIHQRRHARISDVEILAIHALGGILSNLRISEMFGVSEHYVSALLLGRRRNPHGANTPTPKAIRVMEELDDAILDRICDLYQSGMSQRKIASELDLPRAKVRTVLINRGLAKKWSGYPHKAA